MKKEELNNLIEECLIRKDWNNPIIKPANAFSLREYNGYNLLTVPYLMEKREHTQPFFATFNQIRKEGGKVKKGCKSYPIIFWKLITVTKGEKIGETFPIMKSFNVFNVADIENINFKEEKFIKPQTDVIDTIKKYINREAINFTENTGNAFYQPSTDTINIGACKTVGGYEEAIIHESVHSTGHEKRLHRKDITKVNKFGSVDYATEEMVAEFGVYLIAQTKEQKTNAVAYISTWIQALQKQDRIKEAIKAFYQATKAEKFILQ